MGKETADEMREIASSQTAKEGKGRTAKPKAAQPAEQQPPLALRLLPQVFTNGVDVMVGEGDTDLYVVKDFAGVPIQLLIVPKAVSQRLVEMYLEKHT